MQCKSRLISLKEPKVKQSFIQELDSKKALVDELEEFEFDSAKIFDKEELIAFIWVSEKTWKIKDGLEKNREFFFKNILGPLKKEIDLFLMMDLRFSSIHPLSVEKAKKSPKLSFGQSIDIINQSGDFERIELVERLFDLPLAQKTQEASPVGNPIKIANPKKPIIEEILTDFIDSNKIRSATETSPTDELHQLSLLFEPLFSPNLDSIEVINKNKLIVVLYEKEIIFRKTLHDNRINMGSLSVNYSKKRRTLIVNFRLK